jgi:hypothetical protein
MKQHQDQPNEANHASARTSSAMITAITVSTGNYLCFCSPPYVAKHSGQSIPVFATHRSHLGLARTMQQRAR